MRKTELALLACVVMLAARPAPVTAQDSSGDSTDSDDDSPRVDFGFTAGAVMPTRWSNLVLLGSISSSSGVIEQVLARDLRVESNTAYTGSVTYWRGRYGFRTQVGFSRSSLLVGPVPVGGNPVFPATANSAAVDTWSYDARGAIGLLDYRPTRWIWPYGFVGLGGVTWKLNTPISPPLTFVGSGPVAAAGANTVVVAGNGNQFLLAIDQLSTETVFAVNYGIGADFRIPAGRVGVGLRVELADTVSPSPLHVSVRNLSPVGGFVPDAGVSFPLVHQFSATAGLVVRVGR